MGYLGCILELQGHALLHLSFEGYTHKISFLMIVRPISSLNMTACRHTFASAVVGSPVLPNRCPTQLPAGPVL
ncbi:hypothetical protein ES288_A08G182600v1 [Gossypium darwinii]|uniref:Uncharacterized protein n=2 Tax=Gossypium TaxID=3633 RepID=A0A5D2PHK9_GOSTO|nr:hypothetical protein ES288_A08G182600v1 [Gossypium darwinii]TYI15396.1 hypothetical protein ES332_A08G183000v1 [Gossypium tomentosum]